MLVFSRKGKFFSFPTKKKVNLVSNLFKLFNFFNNLKINWFELNDTKIMKLLEN